MVKSESILRRELKAMADELLLFQAWYKNDNYTEKEKDLKEAFTKEVWNEWICNGSSSASLNLGQGILYAVKEVTKDFDGLNVSYKVESRDIPKLPTGKNLKGKIFDE